MIGIPVFVDSAAASGGLSRCFFFHIEVDETLDPWGLTIDNTSFPFLMIGLSGVLLSPADGASLFTEVSQISSLVALVEEAEGRFVEISYLWLPSKLFGAADIHRNEVFRVGRLLFTLGVHYRNGGLELPAFLDRALALRQEIERSPAETLVFAQWASGEFERGRRWRNNEEPPPMAGGDDGDPQPPPIDPPPKPPQAGPERRRPRRLLEME